MLKHDPRTQRTVCVIGMVFNDDCCHTRDSAARLQHITDLS